MAEEQFESVQLVGRRVPDFQTNEDGSGRKVQTELPGTYEYGIMFGKKFHALGSFHAGNVLRADGAHVEPDDERPVDEGESQA
jgi:hypothetical protein